MTFAHSRLIPLSVLTKALERDQYLIDKALHILSVEEPGCTFTGVTAVSALLNHWLVNRELGYYISDKPGDNITTLTVIPVDGDCGKGLDTLEDWITIDKAELAGLLKSRNLTVPDCLNHTPGEQAPAANTRHTAATATRKAKKEKRLADLRVFIGDVYEALDKNGSKPKIGPKMTHLGARIHDGTGGGRKSLPVSKAHLFKCFVERHPEHRIKLATFEDDLDGIATVMPGRKRLGPKELKEMLATARVLP